MPTRRFFLKNSALFLPIMGGVYGCSTPIKKNFSIKKNIGSVVIVGGGFSGATLAKYLSIWSNGAVKVTLIEKNKFFYSCPMSNLVLGGVKRINFLKHNFDNLVKRGINVVNDEVVFIDPEKKILTTRTGLTFRSDKIVVSPGIDFRHHEIDGLTLSAQRRVLHGWTAGAQTMALRAQLMSMADGDVFIISVPPAPYRCPPGPYERACQVANYFKKHKPRSKVVILDANADIQSKKSLFLNVWKSLYKNIIEYIPNTEISAISLKEKMLISQFGDKIKGDVLNLISPNQSGSIARMAGLVTDNDRWCRVNWKSFESVNYPDIHVLGDSTLSSSKMPKSAHMANQHGKVAALAIINQLSGNELLSYKMINACYSFIDPKKAVHVSRVYAYDNLKKTVIPLPNAGGLSEKPSIQEGHHALAWAENIWADTLN